MVYAHFYKQLESLALKAFPSLAEAGKVEWDHLISPLEIRLPKSILTSAQTAISALYELSHSSAYQAELQDPGGMRQAPARNRSLLMAYDFHTNEAGECFLVEVNTNAAGFLLASLMEMTHGGSALASYAPLKSLSAAFEEELELSGRHGRQIAIADEEIPQQKMYAEFLMYRDWLNQNGWSATLAESKSLQWNGQALLNAHGEKIDFIYNRTTDFYLEDLNHLALRQAFLNNGVCLSPNPREYWLLADKQRLVQLSDSEFLAKVGAGPEQREAIARVLIPTFDKSSFPSEEEIWAQRRSLFFKPKRSYGGKSVYRGESVSKKVFERLMAEDILIQKFQPAQKIPTEDPRSVLSNWKFDVRFFVYGDQIQLAAARIYQGQVTNFASPMGGFTKIVFEK